ncbi:MAG: DNA gyrase inhibitor YacG [Octadecabacter sp.]|nr:DNA gyrase inhibitor YacG [Octadecabacter sp.]
MACPICDKKTIAEFRPFCSRRCGNLDLGKWLDGGYAIPSTDPDDLDDLTDALEKAAEDPDLPRLS